MRVALESLRFVVIFVLMAVLLNFISFLMYYPIFGENAERYIGWTAFIGSLVIMFFLYRKKEWGKGVFNKQILFLSLVMVILLATLIPDFTPDHFGSDRFVYSYGFPFPFITIYSVVDAHFVIPNLFFNRGRGVNVGMFGILLNFLVFYFILRFILGKISKSSQMAEKT
ncbi:hypothetical protein J416_12689 [Gracilibacillus halophilus YIM-C55.5]|uniref:Uncharacterized protein n=1 Tax=Gracilibacillus halophilus YIM-C55.5 TaxID=1308866 RepID=N4WSE0_9BACI|nr:hypothetical protein [Gracilibacillus halophilus]ENH96061.1 hypothetical protein J416_12689 [Gracilibacillus halophilus YIM-C55.5]